MFLPNEVDVEMAKTVDGIGEAAPLEDAVMEKEALDADLKNSGLELNEKEQEVIEEAGELPLEDMTADTAYATTRCVGCVGSHTGTGVEVIVHNL